MAAVIIWSVPEWSNYPGMANLSWVKQLGRPEEAGFGNFGSDLTSVKTLRAALTNVQIRGSAKSLTRFRDNFAPIYKSLQCVQAPRRPVAKFSP
ncbi:hypothetical protein SAMN04488039_10391 [Sulfitobacter dubius]|nr:hypothetical protein SAMN04488039_10391 [Sulfitobacter dubius]